LRVPKDSKDLPDEVPFLLIGGGTASFSAFRAIKSHIPKAKVLVITEETQMPYMRPPISKEIWFSATDSTAESDQLKFKQWNGVERNLFYEPDDFYIDPTKLMESENGGVAVARGYRVKKIDVCERKVILEDGKEIKYGACLLATGEMVKT
jgi:apoptosis-inducing factor 1